MSVQGVGNFYVVTFDHGVEIEMMLPGTGRVVRFVDQSAQHDLDGGLQAVPAAVSASPRRYADYRVSLRQRLRALISRRAST